jgi:oligopeptidase B
MKIRFLRALLGMTTLLASFAAPAADSLPEAPVAPRQPRDVSVHGERRIDDYFWLRDRDDPRVLRYLEAENAYTEAWLAPRAAFRESLYREMLGRIQQDDEEVPYRKGGWWYSSRTLQGQQYPRYIRRAAAGEERRLDLQAPEELLLDLNTMAAGKPYIALGSLEVSPDGRRLAFSTDETGGRDYVLQVKDLQHGELLPLRIADVEGVVWGNDDRTLYYVTVDAAKRPYRLWRHRLGEAGPDRLLYEEKDDAFELHVGKTRDERYVVLVSDSSDSSETRVLDADPPDAKPRVVFRRRARVEYSIDHRDGRFYVLINDTGRNNRLVRVDARRPDLARAEELIAHRPSVMLEEIDLFARHLVVTERVAGSLQLRVRDLASGAEHRIAFDETAYTAQVDDNEEFGTTVLRFAFSSLTTPESIFDYDLDSRERVLRKRQPVLGGYDPERYASERLFARAPDGTEVPISLVYRRDLRRPGTPQPLLLYGYGAYGIPIDPRFSSARVSLLDRGVVFAIAHVRGGGDLGRTWYEAGKMARKRTTFTDFIACAEHLVAAGWTAPERLIIQGGSAGGLLMGAVTNLRPELFRAVVAEVPFVDVISTMLDESLPLTTGEFTEWGNPKVKSQYRWMRAYSPYDNLRRGPYPAFFVETGINDSQVAYWEPAKYVAKLRALKTDTRPVLMSVNLGAGHGGASGRFDALRELSLSTTFMLDQWGLLPH